MEAPRPPHHNRTYPPLSGPLHQRHATIPLVKLLIGVLRSSIYRSKQLISFVSSRIPHTHYCSGGINHLLGRVPFDFAFSGFGFTALSHLQQPFLVRFFAWWVFAMLGRSHSMGPQARAIRRSGFLFLYTFVSRCWREGQGRALDCWLARNLGIPSSNRIESSRG
jgi:hypothetical protein